MKTRTYTCNRRLESRSWTFGKKVSAFLRNRLSVMLPAPGFGTSAAGWGFTGPAVGSPALLFSSGCCACRGGSGLLHLSVFLVVPSPAPRCVCSPHARPSVLSPGGDAGPRGLADFRGAHTFVGEVHNCFWCLGALQSNLVTCHISAYCPAE